MEKQVAMLKECSFFGEDLPEPQKARRQTQLCEKFNVDIFSLWEPVNVHSISGLLKPV